MSAVTWWELKCDAGRECDTFGPMKARAVAEVLVAADKVGWRHGYPTGVLRPHRKLDFCPMHQEVWRGW